MFTSVLDVDLLIISYLPLKDQCTFAICSRDLRTLIYSADTAYHSFQKVIKVATKETRGKQFDITVHQKVKNALLALLPKMVGDIIGPFKRNPLLIRSGTRNPRAWVLAYSLGRFVNLKISDVAYNNQDWFTHFMVCGMVRTCKVDFETVLKIAHIEDTHGRQENLIIHTISRTKEIHHVYLEPIDLMINLILSKVLWEPKSWIKDHPRYVAFLLNSGSPLVSLCEWWGMKYCWTYVPWGEPLFDVPFNFENIKKGVQEWNDVHSGLAQEHCVDESIMLHPELFSFLPDISPESLLTTIRSAKGEDVVNPQFLIHCLEKIPHYSHFLWYFIKWNKRARAYFEKHINITLPDLISYLYPDEPKLLAFAEKSTPEDDLSMFCSLMSHQN